MCDESYSSNLSGKEVVSVKMEKIQKVFISELVKEMQDCKMESLFWWTDMPILIIINSLNSSDEN